MPTFQAACSLSPGQNTEFSPMRALTYRIPILRANRSLDNPMKFLCSCGTVLYLSVLCQTSLAGSLTADHQDVERGDIIRNNSDAVDNLRRFQERAAPAGQEQPLHPIEPSGRNPPLRDDNGRASNSSG